MCFNACHRSPVPLSNAANDEKVLACVEKLSHPWVPTESFLADLEIKIRDRGKAFTVKGQSAFRGMNDFYAEFDGFGIPAAVVLIKSEAFTLLIPHEQTAYVGQAQKGLEKFLHLSVNLQEVLQLMAGRSPKAMVVDYEHLQLQGKKLRARVRVENAYDAELEIDPAACRLRKSKNLLNLNDKISFHQPRRGENQSGFQIDYASYFVMWKLNKIQVKENLKDDIFQLPLSSTVNVSSIDEM